MKHPSHGTPWPGDQRPEPRSARQPFNWSWAVSALSVLGLAFALFALPLLYLVTHFGAGWRLDRQCPPEARDESWLLVWPISKQCNGFEFVDASLNYAILTCLVVIVVAVATLIAVRHLSRSKAKDQT